MKLFRMLFPKSSELADAQKRIERLEADKAELQTRNTALWTSYHEAENRYLEATKERDAVKKIVREQTDADLLLVSARITQTVIAGKKPAPSDVSEQNRLLAQQQALSPIQYYASSPYQQQMGVLGQIGLGSILSRYP